MQSLFTWNESFLTHLPSVDEQHQRLVNLINDIGERVISAETIDPQAFASARDILYDYASFHFSDEEALMEQAGLDTRHVEVHRVTHRVFAMEAQSLVELGDDISPERVRFLVEYLVHWLAYHILGTDQSMARQIEAIKNGRSPAAAFDDDAEYIQTSTDPLLAALKGLFQVVSARNHELRMLNSELEERVKQRTRDLEQANHQLQMLSTQDELTGLPNRRFAVLTLGHLWAETQRYGNPLAVLLLDADRFKEVNDGFGHATGDALLQALSARLRQSVRSSDIVCRLGGDEFLVICTQGTYAAAAEVARKILATRQPFFDADGTECWNGAVSIGVAEAGKSMAGFEDLLEAADKALYVAKRQGGARMAGSQAG